MMKTILALIFTFFSFQSFAQNPDTRFKDDKDSIKTSVQPLTKKGKPLSRKKNGSRDLTTLGYQIGGYTVLGINLERRVNNVLGLHAGAGYYGFTGGLKFHVTPTVNSFFFNANFKDGGFGKLRVIALEMGSHIPLSQNSNFGILWQFGPAYVLKMSDRISNELYEGTKPDIILSMGIGFSW